MDVDRSMRREGRAAIVAMIVALVGVSCAAFVANDDSRLQADADRGRVPVWTIEQDHRTVTASALPDEGRLRTGTAPAPPAETVDPRRR